MGHGGDDLVTVHLGGVVHGGLHVGVLLKAVHLGGGVDRIDHMGVGVQLVRGAEDADLAGGDLVRVLLGGRDVTPHNIGRGYW